MTAQKPKPPADADDAEQSRRFINMAREVGADETPGATDRAFEKVIQSPHLQTSEKKPSGPADAAASRNRRKG